MVPLIASASLYKEPYNTAKLPDVNIAILPDANECDFNNGDCEETCVNTIGSYYCYCDVPNTLDVDNRTCTGTYICF